MRDFNAAKGSSKVALVASFPYPEIRNVFPLIRDTLIRIKENVYKGSPGNNKNIKLLFDKIASEKEIYEQNYGRAIFILENALRNHAVTIDDSLRCIALLKTLLVKIKNLNKALEMQYILENKWHRKSDTVQIDYGIKESELYNMIGLRSEAIKQRRKEFALRANKKDTDAVVNFYNDMGVFYNRKKNADSAEIYFLKAKKLLSQKKWNKAREDHYNFYKGLVDGNLGLSYFIRGDIERAIPLLRHDTYYSTKTKNFESAFNSYNLLVKCYLRLNNKEAARACLDTAEHLLTEKLKAPDFRLRFLSARADYFYFIGDFRNASQSYRSYYNLSDSIFIIEKEKELINQGVAFNLQKNEFEFAEKENALKHLQTEEARQRSYKIYFIAGLLLLSFIIVLLVKNNRSFKKREAQLSHKNKQIQVQHSQIEQTLKEKEALIREIHHRVKNNLQIINSMLNLQIGKIQDEKTESIFFEAKQRINAIALTHQMLYQKTTISNINLGEYIETLVRQIEAAMSSTTIRMRTEIISTNERLTIDGAVPLGLVINELLTNAYKHAFPKGKKGTITVSLSENQDTYLIRVSDDGVGLPNDFNHVESKTLGMELIFILVEQLDSKLIIESENGSAFTFGIKKHN